ncbi:MAG TPA: hypothetical protein VHT73_05575 [Thermodesulfobacteriota bacterium]|nr:hypothetical protein [Thermodesulfobacteriota bacterium]
MRHKGQIEGQRLNFLSALFALCGENISKEYNLYEVGRQCGYNTAETKQIVEELSNSDLIKVQEGSDKILITPKGIEMMKRTIEYSNNPEAT